MITWREAHEKGLVYMKLERPFGPQLADLFQWLNDETPGGEA